MRHAMPDLPHAFEASEPRCIRSIWPTLWQLGQCSAPASLAVLPMQRACQNLANVAASCTQGGPTAARACSAHKASATTQQMNSISSARSLASPLAVRQQRHLAPLQCMCARRCTARSIPALKTRQHVRQHALSRRPKGMHICVCACTAML